MKFVLFEAFNSVAGLPKLDLILYFRFTILLNLLSNTLASKSPLTFELPFGFLPSSKSLINGMISSILKEPFAFV